MRYKYGNATAAAIGSGSGHKNRAQAIEESNASSSVMMSSTGQEQSLRGKLGSTTHGSGKTHINVGKINYGGAAAKDTNIAASSNLDETEEDDSESMSMSVSQQDTKYNAAWNKLREKYLGGGANDDDDDSDDDDDDDDDYLDSDDK